MHHFIVLSLSTIVSTNVQPLPRALLTSFSYTPPLPTRTPNDHVIPCDACCLKTNLTSLRR